MSRHVTPELAKLAATRAAACDYMYYLKFDNDLNPFCTDGARNDWQRGFDNAGPRSYESPEIVLYDTIYLRGRAAAEIIAQHKGELDESLRPTVPHDCVEEEPNLRS